MGLVAAGIKIIDDSDRHTDIGTPHVESSEQQSHLIFAFHYGEPRKRGPMQSDNSREHLTQAISQPPFIVRYTNRHRKLTRCC